ncbi:hypothetical protein PWT90_11009 [Aphanocladium album]|nr:hypothetical protein PWT90_11009 [Aphanocladium album]
MDLAIDYRRAEQRRMYAPASSFGQHDYAGHVEDVGAHSPGGNYTVAAAPGCCETHNSCRRPVEAGCGGCQTMMPQATYLVLGNAHQCHPHPHQHLQHLQHQQHYEYSCSGMPPRMRSSSVSHGQALPQFATSGQHQPQHQPQKNPSQQPPPPPMYYLPPQRQQQHAAAAAQFQLPQLYPGGISADEQQQQQQQQRPQGSSCGSPPPMQNNAHPMQQQLLTFHAGRAGGVGGGGGPSTNNNNNNNNNNSLQGISGVSGISEIPYMTAAGYHAFGSQGASLPPPPSPSAASSSAHGWLKEAAEAARFENDNNRPGSSSQPVAAPLASSTGAAPRIL